MYISPHPTNSIAPHFTLAQYYLSQALDYLYLMDEDQESLQRIESAVYVLAIPERELNAGDNIDV